MRRSRKAKAPECGLLPSQSSRRSIDVTLGVQPNMGRLGTILLVLAMTALSSACLVLSVNPGYDEATIGWDPNLVGFWVDADDKATLQIERGEWKSYRIHYIHPIETGVLTGYLSSIGKERYLDVMPARGEDRGSFLLPLHALLHLRLDGDRLELTPLAYDWFSDQLRAGRPIPGLNAVLDQKENALLVSPGDRLRDWLRVQSVDGPAFGASATFERKNPK